MFFNLETSEKLKMLLQAFEVEEGFEVVVVGIDDAGIDFGTGGMVAGGMEEEGGAQVATLIARGAEVGEHIDGGLTVTMGRIGIKLLIDIECLTLYVGC